MPHTKKHNNGCLAPHVGPRGTHWESRFKMRTQVGIVGAGPAGLMLAHLLRREAIDSVVLERRSREYIEGRVRAGVIEQWVADLLVETGLGERMRREGLLHRGINISFAGSLHHLDFTDLIGKHITVYGQQEVVKDLVAARLDGGAEILFEVEDVGICDFAGAAPRIRFRNKGGEAVELACDFIAGCDGSHGVCRPSIPPGVLTSFEREYPYGWLGILAESPPPCEELIYAYHERGFGLYSMRSPTLSRLYLQCSADEDLKNWPDERVWQELHARLGGSSKLAEGKVLLKGVTPMRSVVVEPMQYGKLFLAGDSAHIVPPTGAKGMKTAIGEMRVAEPGADGENAPLRDVAHEAGLAQALHDGVVVHDDQRILAMDSRNRPNHAGRQVEVRALPVAGQVLRAARDRAVRADDARAGDADERREPEFFGLGRADELAQHGDQRLDRLVPLRRVIGVAPTLRFPNFGRARSRCKLDDAGADVGPADIGGEDAIEA